MSTITLQEAEVKLRELIQKLQPGQEILITDNQQPVAKLISERRVHGNPRVPGNCKGMITLLVEDDEHLKDFAEYMP